MNLNQVTLPALDVERSTAFYKTLGLRLIVDALPHYVRFECPDGESTLSVHKVEELPVSEGVIVYFEVENLDETVRNLMDKGIIFKTEITDQPWLWTEIELVDPDGNKIKIFTAGKNRKNPPWRI